MNVILNKYSNEARREEREQFKKNYEIILSIKNLGKENLLKVGILRSPVQIR